MKFLPENPKVQAQYNCWEWAGATKLITSVAITCIWSVKKLIRCLQKPWFLTQLHGNETDVKPAAWSISCISLRSIPYKICDKDDFNTSILSHRNANDLNLTENISLTPLIINNKSKCPCGASWMLTKRISFWSCIFNEFSNFRCIVSMKRWGVIPRNLDKN